MFTNISKFKMVGDKSPIIPELHHYRRYLRISYIRNSLRSREKKIATTSSQQQFPNRSLIMYIQQLHDTPLFNPDATSSRAQSHSPDTNTLFSKRKHKNGTVREFRTGIVYTKHFT